MEEPLGKDKGTPTPRIPKFDIPEPTQPLFKIPKPTVPKLDIPHPPISKLEVPERTEPDFDIPELVIPRFDIPEPTTPKFDIPFPQPTPILKPSFKTTPFFRGPSGSGESRGPFGGKMFGAWFVRKHPIPTAEQFARGTLKIKIGGGKPSITRLGRKLPRGSKLGGLTIGVSGGRGKPLRLAFPKLGVGRGLRLDFGFSKKKRRRRR